MEKIDLFDSMNYELQREELLARIAQSLQLDKTRKIRMEDAYRSVASLLNNDQGFFKNIESDVYAQGSVAIGATVKPLNGNEFDLDIVVHIKELFYNYKPSEIYDHLFSLLENDARYKDKIERKNRCIRICYANDFHMDIMPGCIVAKLNDHNIKVPDRDLKDWTDSNPKGFAEWFLNRCKIERLSVLENYRLQLINLKAEIEDLPSDEFYSKSPLQRAVQLLKRYRDIYFENSKEYATSSIILTTLLARFYNGENSIYATIENTVLKVRESYLQAAKNYHRFKVFNPVNNNEEFTDKWTAEHYKQFFNFINDFSEKWEKLKKTFTESSVKYVQLFGEGIYKQSLQSQIKQMSRFSNDKNTVDSGLIMRGAAYTTANGSISTNQGYKNTKHHEFGE